MTKLKRKRASSLVEGDFVGWPPSFPLCTMKVVRIDSWGLRDKGRCISMRRLLPSGKISRGMGGCCIVPLTTLFHVRTRAALAFMARMSKAKQTRVKSRTA